MKLTFEEYLALGQRQAQETARRLNTQRAEFEAHNPGDYLYLGDVDTDEGRSYTSRITGFTGD